MSFTKYIKSHDYFGHRIEFNFNKTGSSHNTFIGGSVSILIKMAILSYIYLLVKKLVNNEDDKNTTVTSILDKNKLGEVNFKDTKTNIVLALYNGTS